MRVFDKKSKSVFPPRAVAFRPFTALLVVAAVNA